MARREPDLNYLVEWIALADVPVGNLFKDELLASSRTWYAANLPLRYPNTVNEMLYAFLLNEWAEAHP